MKCQHRLLAPAINLDYVEAPWLHTTTVWLAVNVANPEDFEVVEVVVADWRHQLLDADGGWSTALVAFGGIAEVVAARRGPVCNALITLNFAGCDSERIAQATDLIVQLLHSTPFESPKADFAAVLAHRQRQLRQARTQPHAQALQQCQSLLRPQSTPPVQEWSLPALQDRWDQLRRSCELHALVASPMPASTLIEPLAAGLRPLSTTERSPMIPVRPQRVTAELQTYLLQAPIPEQVVIGLHSPITVADERFPALRAALGVWATNPNSRILRELRTHRELVYRIQAHHDLWTGDVLLMLPIEASDHEHAVALVLQELNAIQTIPVPTAELLQTRQTLLRDATLQWEHPRRLLDHVLSLRIAGGDPTQSDSLWALRSLDASAIVTASAQLHPAACVFVRNP